jgi:hypothetical protein
MRSSGIYEFGRMQDKFDLIIPPMQPYLKAFVSSCLLTEEEEEEEEEEEDPIYHYFFINQFIIY